MNLCANPTLVNATNGSLLIPLREDHLLVARLTMSAVATICGFDIDQVDDMKDAVTEASHMMIRRMPDRTDLMLRFFTERDGLTVEILGCGPMGDPEAEERDAVCLCILRSLVQEVTVLDKGVKLRKDK